MLSFSTELPSDTIMPCRQRCDLEAERFVESMRRSNEATRKQHLFTSADDNRFSLSEMPIAPPIPTLEQDEEFTMNLEMAVSIVENVVCVLRGSRVESFDLTGRSK